MIWCDKLTGIIPILFWLARLQDKEITIRTSNRIVPPHHRLKLVTDKSEKRPITTIPPVMEQSACNMY
jgi:hypothetical protein